MSGRLYAASNAENLLIEFSPDGRKRLRTLAVLRPIGVLLSRADATGREVLFVGENGRSTNSSVLIVDVASFAVETKLTHPQLQHPSGMCLLQPELLLVLSQVTGQVISFNLTDNNRGDNVCFPKDDVE